MMDTTELLLDTLQGQLLSQAAWYDLRDMEKRRAVTARVARQFLMMQKVLGTTCFMEIGAHEAQFSRNVRKEYPDARIYAFEANPHVYAQYHHNFPASPGPRIDYRHLAVGHEDGTTDFLLAAQIEGKDEPLESTRNSLLPRKGAGHSYHTVSVPITRLSTFVQREHLEQERLCLWIDAEGATRQILEGAISILPQVTSMLLEVELEPVWEGQWTARDVMRWCHDHDLIPLLRDFARPKQYNCIVIKRPMWASGEFHFSQYIQRCIRHRVENIAST